MILSIVYMVTIISIIVSVIAGAAIYTIDKNDKRDDEAN